MLLSCEIRKFNATPNRRQDEEDTDSTAIDDSEGRQHCVRWSIIALQSGEENLAPFSNPETCRVDNRPDSGMPAREMIV